jgi:hypothetical protein
MCVAPNPTEHLRRPVPHDFDPAAKNISSSTHPIPTWDHRDPEASLNKLYDFAEAQADRAVYWYYKNKRKKAWGSRITRFGMIIFTAVGGMVPILINAIADKANEAEQLRWNQYGYLALGMAALFLALDRFSGGSSGWMRYVTTQTRIESLMEELRFDWQDQKAALGAAPYAAEKIVTCISRLKSFSAAVRAEIEKETLAWVTEFRSNLEQLEKETGHALEEARKQARIDAEAALAAQKAAIDALRPGAVNVTMKIDAKFTAGAAIEIDGVRKDENVIGPTYGISNLSPGPHSISLIATGPGGIAHKSSQIVMVTSNAIASVTIELKLP